MKQAKEEAQAEVEAYKSEREKLYKEHETKVRIDKFAPPVCYMLSIINLLVQFN